MTDSEILWEAAEHCETRKFSAYSCDCIGAVALELGLSYTKSNKIVKRYRSLFLEKKTVPTYWLTKEKPTGLGAEGDEEELRDLRVTMLCLAAAVFNDEDSNDEPAKERTQSKPIETAIPEAKDETFQERLGRGGVFPAKA